MTQELSENFQLADTLDEELFVFPPSFAQQRLWFLDRLMPGQPVYNIPIALHNQGPLNFTALKQSLNEIVRRHESLRTTFMMVDGQLIQAVSPSLDLNVPVIDLRDLPPERRQAEAQQLAYAEARCPFDLERGPLLRVTLLRLAEAEQVLMLTMHHIISDGWSLNLFVGEFKELYTAFSAGKPSPLPELPIQYADFALWQQEWLQGEILESQLAYWKERLSGDVPVLQLPTDRPRPSVPTIRGAHQAVTISKSLTEALKALSRREGVTLFMTLLAALKTLLYRYTGSEDIIVGSPIAGRNRAELEGVIGFFVNTLVLRTDLAGNPSFRQLLTQVREVTLGASAHQDLPFEKLVEELQPSRNLSQTPLFQVAFVLAPPMPALDAGWTLSDLDVDTGTAKLDLSLELQESPEGLIGWFEYNTDLFDAGTLQRMVGHFQTLLEGIVANPEQRLSDLPLLTQPEQQQLLSWNETEADYPDETCIHHLFEAQVEKTPNAVALVFEGKQLTYQELNSKANQLAHYLRSLGVGPEGLVGICVERSLEMVVGLLGILKAGGAYVPLDPAYPSERLAFMLEDSSVPVLLTQSHLIPLLPKHQGCVVCLDTDWEVLAQGCPENPVSGVTADNLAYVIYTSGSTGKPKGVLLEHRGLCNLATAQQTLFDVRPDSRVLQFASFSFDASVWEIFMAVAAGARLVLGTRDSLLPGPALIQLCKDQAITTVTLPPSVLAVLPVEEFPTLQTLIVAGEASSADLVARWAPDRRFFNAYGPTETTVCATVAECFDGKTKLPIGHPIANTQVYLLDAQMQPVPIGVPGELYIGGAGLARGYLNRPDLTAEKFIANPFSDAKHTRLYKTGDLARYLPDGNIEFLGRIDHQVKIRGFRIEIGEIESVLSQHPDVREVAVIDREDSSGDKRLVAYIVSNLAPNRTPFKSECLAELAGNCPLQLQTEEISITGICVIGVPDTWSKRERLRLRLQLPRDSHEHWFLGTIVSREGTRAEIEFELTLSERLLLQQSVEFLLETQGFWKVLQPTLIGDLRSFLKQELPDYMVPANFVLLNALPLTANGKVDRKALPAPEGLNLELEATYTAPKTEVEQIIATVWQEVLHLEKVGMYDNFFDLGGHSLLLVQVHSKLRSVLTSDILMVELFKYPTISALAKSLNQESSAASSFQQSHDRAKKQKEAINKQKQRRQAGKENNHG